MSVPKLNWTSSNTYNNMGQYTLIDEKCYKKWENTHRQHVGLY
jgi:hypothetical protein